MMCCYMFVHNILLFKLDHGLLWEYRANHIYYEGNSFKLSGQDRLDYIYLFSITFVLLTAKVQMLLTIVID